MHNYHKMALGGARTLALDTLHKGGAAHERRDQCAPAGGGLRVIASGTQRWRENGNVFRTGQNRYFVSRDTWRKLGARRIRLTSTYPCANRKPVDELY